MHHKHLPLSTVLLAALAAVLLRAPRADAHPLSQGNLDVVIYPDRVTVRARVTQEEFAVTSMAANAAPSAPGADPAGALHDRHASYLASHLHVVAGGAPLAGRVTGVHPPAAGAPDQHIGYDLEYRPASPIDPPGHVELRQDVLSDLQFAPGVKWEATYVVRIGQVGRPANEGLLLTGANNIAVPCEWPATADGAPADGAAVAPGATLPGVVDRARMFREYLHHGVMHILQGYDHLLFISALVLAATTLWDLLKVVTAFTLAHTLTLTLAALRLVHVPSYIVEPLIAASIVFVAVQNVVWPKRTRGWGRLAAAFFFGLFHGLGFAGGLLDAMQEMQGVTIVTAILAFSLGVELGHQMIVLPLFAGLKLARRTQADPAGRERVSLLAQRFGSAAISVAGMFYLVLALRVSFGFAAPS